EPRAHAARAAQAQEYDAPDAATDEQQGVALLALFPQQARRLAVVLVRPQARSRRHRDHRLASRTLDAPARQGAGDRARVAAGAGQGNGQRLLRRKRRPGGGCKANALRATNVCAGFSAASLLVALEVEFARSAIGRDAQMIAVEHLDVEFLGVAPA